MSDIIEEIKQDPKQTNFRIRPDDADKFRELCSSLGYNQADGFEYILKTLDLENAKKSAPGRADEIDQFRHFAYSLVEMYSQSIEYSLEADAKAHDSVDRTLKSKDKTIVDLQDKLERITAELSEVKNTMVLSEGARKAAVKETEETSKKLQKTEATLYDKERLISMLQKQVDESGEQSKEYKALKTAYDSLEKKADKDLRAAEKEKDAALKELRTELQAEITSMRSELMESRLREQSLLGQIELLKAEKEAVRASVLSEARMQHDAEMKELRDKLEQRTEEVLALQKAAITTGKDAAAK